MTPEGAIPRSQYSDFTLSGSLGLRPAGNHSLFLTYQRSQAENTGIPGGAPIALAATARYTLARRELIGAEYTIPNISPTVPLLSFRASRQEIDRNVEIIQSPTMTVTPHATHTTANIQVESKVFLSKENSLTLGADLWQRELESLRERFNSIKNEITEERPVPRSKYFNGGIYAQDEWLMPLSGATLVAGVRFDKISVTNDETWNPEYVITNGIVESPPTGQTLLWPKGTALNESWSANVGITCPLMDHLDVRVLTATAFRSPSLEERYQFIDLGSIVRVGNPGLQPERSVGVNAGVSFHSDEVSVQSDFFLNQLSNLVTEISGSFEGRPAYIKTNIGESRLYGFELSGEKPVGDWGAGQFSLAYVRGEDTRNHVDLPQIPPVQGLIAMRAHNLSAGTVEVSSHFAFAKANAAAGEISTGGYTVVGLAFTSIAVRAWESTLTLHAGVQNIFDKNYTNFLSTLRGEVRSEPGRGFYFSVSAAI